METQIKVSVVVPVYNVAAYLPECLDSLTGQTLREIEIICVNDGSTDNSLEILREYEKKDARVHIIDKPNSGYGQTMNMGMDAARGEYLSIVESDDFILADMLETLYRTAQENKLDFVKADFYRFYRQNRTMLQSYNSITLGNYDAYNKVLCPAEHPEVYRFTVNNWSGIYSMDFINRYHIRHNETPGASYQDNGFWVRVFSRAKRIMFVNTPFYMYRGDNPGSSINNKGKAMAIVTEYQLTEKNWLDADPELKKNFITVFRFKQFGSYYFTFRRIAPELKQDFLRQFTADFQAAEKAGELDRRLFDEKQKKLLEQVLHDPDAFYAENKDDQFVPVTPSAEITDTPKISVIVPAYNTAPYLRKCFDSILRQNLYDFEVIAMDDGSTDNTLELLREYQARDKRFRVYTQENQGAGPARNHAMRYARGKYLCFMDPDDWYPRHNTLKFLYDNAEKHDVKICGGSFSNVDSAGVMHTEFTGTLKDYTFRNEGLMHYADYQFDYGYHRFIYDREMLQREHITFPSLIRFQDPPFFVRAMAAADTFYAVRQVTYCYRWSAARQLNTAQVEALIDGLIHNLRFSSEREYAKLHELTVRRLNVLFRSQIVPFFNAENPQIISRILTAQSCIRQDLLKAAGSEVHYPEHFVLQLLQDAVSGEHSVFMQYLQAQEAAEQTRREAQAMMAEAKKTTAHIKYGYYKNYYRESHPVMHPKISVIVPVYNKASYLMECLDSISQQTLKEIEIIAVNDGSTDDSLPLLVDYWRDDNRLKIFHQKNKGVGNARNFGIAHAKGEYIAFMDPDDAYPDRDVLRRLYLAASANKADICGGAFTMHENGIVQEEFEGIYRKYCFEREGFVDYRDYQFDYGFHRFLYKRDFLDKHKLTFPDYRRFQDPPFFTAAMHAAEKFYALPLPVYSYRASYQVIVWTPEKLSGLLSGLRDNLRLSASGNYAELHAITAERLLKEFCPIVAANVQEGNAEIMARFIAACGCLDFSLLENTGFSMQSVTDAVVQLLHICHPALPDVQQGSVRQLLQEQDNRIQDLTRERDEARAELERYRICLDATRAAFSHRLGMALTSPFRAVKNLLHR
jgi:glycosyltransferase involved in cell wall biosynthesis